MQKILTHIVILLIASFNICCAQYEFAPGDKVLFRDDFSHDTIGAFPGHWHIAPCNKFLAADYSNKKFWKVQKDGSEHALAITTTLRAIDPDMNTKYYLHDSFTVDFDFRFDTLGGCAELYFYTYDNPDSCSKICIHLFYKGSLSIGIVRRDDISDHNKEIAEYPAQFVYKAWHHFALAYKERAIDFYIDQYRVASILDCQFSPYGLSLGCIAPVIYKHFRITTGKDNPTFTKILTEKKFVTHAINFDVNQSIIKPQSMDFITQLAQFLKANPNVKLEIDGHTDSDGEPAANIKLSQDRAGEVKKQLVSLGIDEKRLSTKGFGATKPIQPNTTETGKANNRRVEFIKQ